MRKSCAFILIVCLMTITACGRPAPTPVPVAQAATQAPPAAPSATPTARPSDPPSPTATTASTATPTLQSPTATPIHTPAPTAVPSPSPTPAPVASVTGDSINVRGGPGTVYPIVGQAKKGEILPVVSRTQDGAWLEVTLAGGESGWVSAGLVTLNAPAESLPIAKVIPPTPEAPPPAMPLPSVAAGALSRLRMVAKDDPQQAGRTRFSSGVTEVWCACEVDTAVWKSGDLYTVRVFDAAGNVVAQREYLRFISLKPGTGLKLSQPVYAQSGVFPDGSYRTEMLLNGQVVATLRWSVGP